MVLATVLRQLPFKLADACHRTIELNRQLTTLDYCSLVKRLGLLQFFLFVEEFLPKLLVLNHQVGSVGLVQLGGVYAVLLLELLAVLRANGCQFMLLNSHLQSVDQYHFHKVTTVLLLLS